MNDEVELAPFIFDLSENGVHRRRVSDVAMASDERAKALGQRTHALLQRIALIGEREFRARVMGRLGYAPGDRTVVGDAQNEPALARQNARSRQACCRVCH